MNARFFVIAGIVVSFVAVPSIGNGADGLDVLQQQIDARRGKMSQLQEQIDTLKKTLAAKQQEKLSLQNQLSLINGRMQKTSLSIAVSREQLSATELTLKQIGLRLDARRALLNEQQVRLSELLRTLEETGRETAITLLARGETLSDFFVASEQLQDTHSQLGEVTATTQGIVTQLARDKEQYEQTRTQLRNVVDKLAAQHDTLKEQNVDKAQLLLRTQESEQKFQKLVADLRREYRATEGEISAIEQRVRRSKGKGSGSSLPSGPVVMQWPVPSHIVTAAYHDPDYPFRHVFEHPGMDMRAPQGTPVRAAAAGLVARAKDAGMGYSYVLLVHTNKISTVYGHLSRITVSEDDQVSAGEIIGYSGGMPGTRGAGPFVTGPHVHFEVRSEGIPVDPADFLQ